MKSLLILFICISSFSFSQDKIFEAIILNADQFQEQKSKGEFLFQFPSATKKEVIDYTASYYKEHFTVSLDEKTAQVIVKMVQNNSDSRHIINRFLIANKINQVKINNSLFKLEVFYNDFLK